MKFYLSGQRTFRNRGCEALVRSTVALIRTELPEATFLVPSDDVAYDSALWPEHASHGVTFVPPFYPFSGRVWTHLKRLPIPLLKSAPYPLPCPPVLKQLLDSVDAVLAIGGDNYSLDYRIPTMIQAVDAFAMDMGKPVYLWGASVGPFEQEPHYVPAIRAHLARMSQIFVRERNSYDYLTGSLGLKNVALAADPAFSLQPEPVNMSSFWPQGPEDVVGINFSPLVARKEFSDGSATQNVMRELLSAILASGRQAVLVPHVFEDPNNNDHVFMSQQVSAAGLTEKVGVVPPLNASQLKFVISHLSMLIAARTHATIAAFSSHVPTISLSYSVKSIGINKMLFDHSDFAIPTKGITAARILAAIEDMYADRSGIIDQLAERSSQMRHAGSGMASRVIQQMDSAGAS